MSPATAENKPAIELIARPHPFSAERIRYELPEGASLAEMLAASGIAGPAHVWVGEHYVPRERWHRAYPRAGALVTVRAVPAGGGAGGKNPLRIVAMIAVVVLSAYTGGAVGAAYGSAYGSLAGAAVSIAGSLLVNALIPPPTPKLDPASGLSMDRGHAITGSRNQLLPYGPIPRVFGRHRLYPPLAALPYTESQGGSQFYRMLFVPGYGPLEISDMRIGETPLDQFQGVEVEVRQGYVTDPPLTIFSNDVFEEALSVEIAQDKQLYQPFYTRELGEGAYPYPNYSAIVTYGAGALVLRDPSDPASIGAYASARDGNLGHATTDPAWWFTVLSFGYYAQANQTPSAWTQRTTQAIAHEISIELTAPQGLVYLRALGLKGLVQIGLAVEYSPAGQNNWSRPTFAEVSGSGEATAAGFLRMAAAEGGAQRLAARWAVAEGQYDVRIRRLYTVAYLVREDLWLPDYLLDGLYWTALRTVRNQDPVQVAGTGLCRIALRIQSTGQLNGLLDRFNCVGQALLPAYDGAAWSAPAATSSPAWALAEVLTGSANARPLAKARLVADELKSWADWCTANGVEYNAVIDARTTIFQLARDICAVGFASLARPDGKYSVLRDLPQATPVQHFTPRNSWGFTGRKTFVEQPHALRVRFLNPDRDWQQDEVTVYADGYDAASASRYETLELFGVTSVQQAWKAGRYHLAVARLRPETYELFADVEHLVCTRGDLVRVAHDVPLWGSSWGRVTALAGQTLTLDEVVTIEAGTGYALRVRTASGGSELFSVVHPGAGEFTALDVVGSLAAVAVGDLAMFGEAASESVELIVQAIEPGSDLTARLVLIDAAPAVHQAWTGPIPPFDSQITLPITREQLPAPAPVIVAIISDESVLVRTVTGLASQMVISFSVAGGTIPATAVQTQYRPAGGGQVWRSAPDVPAASGVVTLTGLIDGQLYDVRLRSVSLWGVPSAWVAAAHTVAGKSGLPADLTGLSLQLVGGQALLAWDQHRDLDVQVGGYIRIRHTPKLVDVTWNDGIDIAGLVPGTATRATLPALSGTYMARAVDSGGRLSPGIALVATTAPALIGYNAIGDLVEHPAFAGGHDGCEIYAAALRLTETDGQAAPAATYTFGQSLDLGAVYTSRVWGELQAEGYAISADIDSRGPIDSWDAFDGPSVDDVTSVIEVRTTDDDPAAAPAWSAWAPLQVGEWRFRAIEARLLLTSADPDHNVRVSQLALHVDMPDRTAAGVGVVVPPAGLAIVFNPAFKATPAIGVTVQNMQQGDYWQPTAQGPGGFTIQVLNAGAGVQRIIDWQAVGYGLAG